MKELTTIEITDLIYARLRGSAIAVAVPEIHLFRHPANPAGEFIVIAPGTNTFAGEQTATIDVNIYVPDQLCTLDRTTHRQTNAERLGTLAKLAREALDWYDTGETYFFRVEAEEIISEQILRYSLINLTVKFQNS